MSQEIKIIPVKELYLWTENPRDPVDVSFTDYDIIARAIKDDAKKWNLPKLLQDMGTYYDFSELPTVVKDGDKYVVYDGNRRIAILKYLQNSDIYRDFWWWLFLSLEPKELVSLTEIPCNLCDKNTALKNIERKHINNGTWSQLDRDYFAYNFRNESKSLFMQFDEVTGLLSKHKKLNQRFVKEEILTEKNLKSIWFCIDNWKLLSMYNKQDTNDILWKLTDLIESWYLKTRTNESKWTIRVQSGYLGKILQDKTWMPITDFSRKWSQCVLSINYNGIDAQSSMDSLGWWEKPARRTPITQYNKDDLLFWRILSLKSWKINDLYSWLCLLYDKFKNNEKILIYILPIIGMSLRLILDVAWREYFKDDPNLSQKDQLLNPFIKQTIKDFKEMNDICRSNFLSLNLGWIENSSIFEAPLWKWAHWQLPTSKQDVLQISYIIADILEYYFKK